MDYNPPFVMLESRWIDFLLASEGRVDAFIKCVKIKLMSKLIILWTPTVASTEVKLSKPHSEYSAKERLPKLLLIVIKNKYC